MALGSYPANERSAKHLDRSLSLALSQSAMESKVSLSDFRGKWLRAAILQTGSVVKHF